MISSSILSTVAGSESLFCICVLNSIGVTSLEPQVERVQRDRHESQDVRRSSFPILLHNSE